MSETEVSEAGSEGRDEGVKGVSETEVREAGK